MALVTIGNQEDTATASSEVEEKPLEIAKDEIFITEDAATKVVELAQKEGKEGWLLRIAIMGGGCSGLSYNFNFLEIKVKSL